MNTKLLCITLLLIGLSCRGGGEGSEANETDVEGSAIREVDKEIRREYEAIHKVHEHLDDDHDGTVDMRESAEFIVEELHSEDNESRQKMFHHQNKDDHISVKDVWGTWYKSEVYNWTVDEVITWLCDVVHLPKYSANFRRNGIRGKDMPRIAINGEGMIQNELGIVDSAHRKKLELRAMDVVLFGPPPVSISWWKDIILVSVLIICVLFAGLAVRERKRSQGKVDGLMNLMRIAEDKLAELQQQMEKTSTQEEEDEDKEENKDDGAPKKRTYSADYVSRRSSVDGSVVQDDTMSLPDSLEDSFVKQLQSKITKLEADKANLLEQLKKQGSSPAELQQLLTQTYLKEHSHWVDQKSNAEKQLATAKRECEKIERRRGTLLGSIRMINSPVLHDADLKINRALVSLKKVMKNLDEYKKRWRTIESLTGLHVVSSSVEIKQEISVEYTSQYSMTDLKEDIIGESMEQEGAYTSSESFDHELDMDDYSAPLRFHIGSTRSMDHPYQHQKQQQQQKMKLKSMKYSASECKLPSSASFPSKSHLGTYQRLEEYTEEPSNSAVPKNNSPSLKRRLFKKSNINNK